jgi:hypothetical protein
MIGMAQTVDWSVHTEQDTVIVDLPRGLELDGDEGKQINEAFFEAIEKPGATKVRTQLRVENALGSGLFNEVQRGAEAAADAGITRWAIVVQERVKGMAFDSQISGLDTKVFEDDEEATAWLEG